LVGTSDLEAPLLNWMVNATDPTEQSHALRAAAAATFRDRNEKARLKPVADLMGGARPAVQKRLLTTLSRVGGSEAANYVARFALNEKGPIAESAVEALGHWTDKTGLDPLATVAERAQNEALRTAAIDTAISSLPQNNWELTKEDKAVIARLRALAKDPTLLGRLDALEKPPVK
jgi:HEAT repeat protein